MQTDLDKYRFRGNSFFDLLSRAEKDLLKPHLVRKEYKKGQTLFRERTFSKGVHLLRKGKVKLFQVNREGKDSIVYIYKKGEYFGYRPLLCKEPHPASAVAIDPVVTLFIPERVFLELLGRSRTLAEQLLISLSHEFSVWINKLMVFNQYSVKERVALSLLIFHNVFENPLRPNKPVAISLSRDDMAGFVGTAKETLVRMLRVFKDEKIITTKGTKITILKKNELFRMIDTY